MNNSGCRRRLRGDSRIINILILLVKLPNYDSSALENYPIIDYNCFMTSQK